MKKFRDATTVFAQSSDIKSRDYLEYRKDMKKKAIAELETREWFEGKLKELHGTDDVKLEKSGVDAHLWFKTSGGVSGGADYRASIKGKEQRFEFQYADKDNLPFYDFKVSKVGKKIKGKRTPYRDKEFLYIIKPSKQFAIFSPQWIMENGEEGGVPAWGNRTAFRVPGGLFKRIFKEDSSLAGVVETIDKKNRLLEIQSGFIERENKLLSGELQKIVDEKRIFKIMPKTLEGFYRACFLVDRVNDRPENYSLWLVYGTTFCSDKLNSYQFAQLMYSLDFLYHASPDRFGQNELGALAETMKKLRRYISKIQKDGLRTSNDLSPLEETVNFLFTVNLYEDMSQELAYSYGIRDFGPVNKIFQSVDSVDSVLANLER